MEFHYSYLLHKVLRNLSISKDVNEILRLLLFGDGEVVNISLSPDESKVVKFLENAEKKTLKKPILKTTSKGVGRDKGSRANFWGWI